MFSVRKRHQYWVQTKELIQLFINWASWYRFPRLPLHFGTRKFLSTSNKLNTWESIQHMAISSQSAPRLLISQVGILASLEKTIPMGQLCRCAFHWYLLQLAISPVTSCENSCFKSFWKSIFSGGKCKKKKKKKKKKWDIGCPFYTQGHNSLIFVDALNQGWWSHLKASQSVAFGQFKCIYYISRSYNWRQCVQPWKAFNTNSTQKNSDSIRQHHCVRLSEQTTEGVGGTCTS